MISADKKHEDIPIDPEHLSGYCFELAEQVADSQRRWVIRRRFLCLELPVYAIFWIQLFCWAFSSSGASYYRHGSQLHSLELSEYVTHLMPLLSMYAVPGFSFLAAWLVIIQADGDSSTRTDLSAAARGLAFQSKSLLALQQVLPAQTWQSELETLRSKARALSDSAALYWLVDGVLPKRPPNVPEKWYERRVDGRLMVLFFLTLVCALCWFNFQGAQ